LIQIKESLAEANIRLETLATTDGLTGLKNNRAYQERLMLEWERGRRYGEPLSLIILDIDWFKQYNDTYGHPGGDDVLKEVGAIIQGEARDIDFAARYGGEEFVIIAPSTDADGAAALAERIRVAIARSVWPMRPITASLGVATSTAMTTTTSELFSQSDAALYHSKKAGRNLVTHYQDICFTSSQPVETREAA
jgi:diguanylate cyclase (GGDEF)-like protein